ncbi:23S rRNA (uracil(1939)-C(5))-methyltransferase RlmD [Patescibacteria group bacterium]|nr:23S rRNA (uracil(1939)-C(5))-methyltransferase RlmD [Patescibacteria group bacterium]
MKSPCPKKDVCGSCGWSHIEYDKQLEQKLSDINGSFKLNGLDLKCTEIIASPQTEHYRNRMDFVIDFEGRVGLREKGKWWRVIDNHTCFIADERIEALFKIVRDWTKTAGLSFYDRKAYTGLLRYAVIRTTCKGESMINIVTSPPSDDEQGFHFIADPQKIETSEKIEKIYQALNKLAENAKPTTLVWSIHHTISDVSYGDEIHTISGPGHIDEVIEGFTYRISPDAFFQTNSHAAAALMNTVLEFAGDLSKKTILDLYCGSGFFSIALTGKAKRTIGIEMVPEMIRDARINAKLNKVQVDYHDTKTEAFDWLKIGADVVIIDPPRAGMHHKVLKDIIEAKPPAVIYVSCNYKNFTREMVKLNEHYRITAIRAIDMFPHTPHVELVTKLERK